MLNKKMSKTVLLSAMLSASLMITGCNDDNDSDSTNNTPENPVATERLTGTVATGAALAGANLHVVNKNGTTKSVVVGADGKFSIDVEKGAPYLLKATKGTGESEVTLYSYASGAGNVNVTQLTTQAILAINQDPENRDYNSLADVYSHWAALVKDSTINEMNAAIDQAAKEVVANLKTVFDANGYNSANYPDIFKTVFVANSTGLDKVLDQVEISGLNNACTGVGSTYSCNVQYLVNGENFSWNYSVNTSGIVININSNNNPNIPSGNYNLKVTTSVMGQGASVTIQNIPKPSNQSEFCAADDVTAQLPNGQFKINSCSFNGTVGNINATINANGFNVTYDVKYEYSAA